LRERLFSRRRTGAWLPFEGVIDAAPFNAGTLAASLFARFRQPSSTFAPVGRDLVVGLTLVPQHMEPVEMIVACGASYLPEFQKRQR